MEASSRGAREAELHEDQAGVIMDDGICGVQSGRPKQERQRRRRVPGDAEEVPSRQPERPERHDAGVDQHLDGVRCPAPRPEEAEEVARRDVEWAHPVHAAGGLVPGTAMAWRLRPDDVATWAKERIDVFSFELLAYRELINANAMPGGTTAADKLPEYFTTAEDITPREHVDIQAASQKWIDSSISKTANVPTDYPYEDFKGTIGGSDVAGSAKYELRQPRPLLTADVHSRKLDIADLGPLVGVQPKGSAARPTGAVPAGGNSARRVSTNAGAPAQASAVTGSRVLPDNPVNLEKLNSADADVRVTAGRLRFPGQVPLKDFAARARLEAGVLTIEPLNFGFAGGEIAARSIHLRREQSGLAQADGIHRRCRAQRYFPGQAGTVVAHRDHDDFGEAHARLQFLASRTGTEVENTRVKHRRYGRS